MNAQRTATAPSDDLPFLDVTAPGFSTRSLDVLEAREQSWCARTPFGLAVLRHQHAGTLLRDRRLRQGSYAWPDKCGLSGSFADFWKRSVISQEGAAHRALRRVARAALSDEFVVTLTDRFEGIATDLLERLRHHEHFDFIDAVSEPYAGRAIALLLDLDQEGAAALSRDASTLGLAMGVDARRHEAAVNAACDRLMRLADDLIARAARGDDRDGYVARLVREASAAGLDDPDAVRDLVVISIFGGVDTTRAQLGFAVELFAAHPAQWTYLRGAPEQVPAAIEEVIRTRPTTTWSTREALEDIDLDGVRIAAGATVHIFVHATATDPTATPYDGFDIRAERKVHFGFGGGAHHCLGQFVARTDMAAALRVMLRSWRSVQLVGTPEHLPDSGNTSPSRLRVSPIWADPAG